LSIQTVVVEDSRVFSRALLQLLSDTGGFTILGVAASIATALAFDGNMAAELVLLDIHLPDGNGLSLIAPLLRRWPRCKILVLTMEDPH
jgi:DNA-binding NarL/FixJ family response regulator